MDRRKYLSFLGTSALAAVAGCSDSDPDTGGGNGGGNGNGDSMDNEQDRVASELRYSASRTRQSGSVTLSVEDPGAASQILITGDHNLERDPVLAAEAGSEIEFAVNLHIPPAGMLKAAGISEELETETSGDFTVAPDHSILLPDPPEGAFEEGDDTFQTTQDQEEGVTYLKFSFERLKNVPTTDTISQESIGSVKRNAIDEFEIGGWESYIDYSDDLQVGILIKNTGTETTDASAYSYNLILYDESGSEIETLGVSLSYLRTEIDPDEQTIVLMEPRGSFDPQQIAEYEIIVECDSDDEGVYCG